MGLAKKVRFSERTSWPTQYLSLIDKVILLQALYRYNQVKMRPCSLGYGPSSSMTGILRRRREDTRTREEPYVRTEVGTGVMCL